MRDSDEITNAEYEIVKAELMAEMQADTPTEPTERREAGWYDDPGGVHQHQAYWDGEKWTGAIRPAGPPEARKPLYRRTWFILVAAVFFLGMLGQILTAISPPPASPEVEATVTRVSDINDVGSFGAFVSVDFEVTNVGQVPAKVSDCQVALGPYRSPDPDTYEFEWQFVVDPGETYSATLAVDVPLDSSWTGVPDLDCILERG